MLNRIQFKTFAGPIEVAWTQEGKLTSIELRSGAASSRPAPLPTGIADLIESLRAYFEDGVPLPHPHWDRIDRSGWSDFQKKVYEAIIHIPHGETRTYQWVAARMGNWGATRAVGQALRKNPIPILVPCHRVVSVHSLGGFMGKALPTDPEILMKKTLIAIEDRYRNPLLPFIRGEKSALPLEPAV